ncbi:MAG: DUF2939 domain-containing protein [Gemmatimonadales bacterium]|nr:DUF2939 domain-containing protein [Gemmatimonadales bacterium]
MARFLRWTLLLVVLGGGAWLYFAPRRAYDRLVKAIAYGDAAELEATVDFVVLRRNLREDLQAGLARRAGDGMGATIAGAMMGAMVDAAVTPSGLSQIITGFGTRDVTENSTDTTAVGTTTAYRYRSLSRVDVLLYPADETPADGGVLTLTRTGMTWKLTRAWSAKLDAQQSGE